MFAPAFFVLKFNKNQSSSYEKLWAKFILGISIMTIFWFISIQIYENAFMKN